MPGRRNQVLDGGAVTSGNYEMLGPIFTRELRTLPRRPRHYVLRVAYLGALWILTLTAWQALVGWERPATLGDVARFHVQLFHLLMHVQLAFVIFFAALSAASAVTTEKDRRTFVLLLMTDLRDQEIVLGKWLGSLLQLLLFLAGSAPLFLMLLFLGGVTPAQVGQAFLILLGAAGAAGSLGCLIALWRDKTFQTLALTVLLLVLYLCLVRGLSLVPPEAGPLATLLALLSQWGDPFRALELVLEPAPAAGEAAALPFQTLSPAVGFLLLALAESVLLNVWSIWGLRRWNPSGEPVISREPPEEDKKERPRVVVAPGPVRPVWSNPILWREIATRAYGRRPLLVKAAYFLVFAWISYFAVGDMERRDWAAAWGLVPIGILSLLLVSAQAVTAITSERDLGALDLLLVTDLTPQEFIFGKLLGIAWNTKEFLLPPLLLIGYYAVRGWLATPPTAQANLESALCLGLGGGVLLAFVMVLGVHVALRAETSRLAVLLTLGTVFFLSAGTLVCVYLILINGQFEYQWLSFIFFLAAGIGGLWWVLNGDRPSAALTLASWLCPLAVFYSVTNILIGRPGLQQSADPLLPFLVTSGAFGFALAAMLIPLLSEFDVALGRTSAGGD
jgi:hypothetical protein